jgi:transcriptional regulator with XRE-family HTH domain
MAKEAQKKRNSRTAVIDGDLMDMYRCEHGWNDLMLATKADVSAKTIERARSGKPIRTDTLAMIAEALGVLPVKIMSVQAVAEIIRPDPSIPQKPRRIACFVIDDESLISEYLETENFEYLMMKWAYRGVLRGGIVNEQIFDGSKIIVAEFSEEDFKRLSRLFSINELLFDDIVYFGAISADEPLDSQLATIKEFSHQRIVELHEARAKLAAARARAKFGQEVTIEIDELGNPKTGNEESDRIMKTLMDDKKKKDSGESRTG